MLAAHSNIKWRITHLETRKDEPALNTRCMMNVERGFLEYAWDMLSNEHAEEYHCPLGTSRWPGYLGIDHQPGGIAFVGTIHNPNEIFPSRCAKAASKMYASRVTLDKWKTLNRDQAVGESIILAQLRDSYLSAIEQWIEFPVWQMFNDLRKIANVRWEDGKTLHLRTLRNARAQLLGLAPVRKHSR